MISSLRVAQVVCELLDVIRPKLVLVVEYMVMCRAGSSLHPDKITSELSIAIYTSRRRH